jgi:hypothetical protein
MATYMLNVSRSALAQQSCSECSIADRLLEEHGGRLKRNGQRVERRMPKPKPVRDVIYFEAPAEGTRLVGGYNLSTKSVCVRFATAFLFPMFVCMYVCIYTDS